MDGKNDVDVDRVQHFSVLVREPRSYVYVWPGLALTVVGAS